MEKLWRANMRVGRILARSTATAGVRFEYGKIMLYLQCGNVVERICAGIGPPKQVGKPFGTLTRDTRPAKKARRRVNDLNPAKRGETAKSGTAPAKKRVNVMRDIGPLKKAERPRDGMPYVSTVSLPRTFEIGMRP